MIFLKSKQGKLAKLAIDRFKADLKREDVFFDLKAAEVAINWINRLSVGGKKFKLSPFQEFIVANIFGWKKLDGTRRFLYSYIEMAKGGGKTTLEAAIALLVLEICGSDGEVYSAATTRDQARICFRYAQSLARDSAQFVSSKVMKHSITVEETNSFFIPLAAEADSLEGRAPNLVIIDEFHAHTTDEVYNSLKSALLKKKNSHMSIITTAGFNKLSACYRLRNTVVDILEGKIFDDATFGLIFTLDADDDWNDSRNWFKANPNLGVTFPMDALEREYESIKIQGASQENNFKTKNLNMWTDASTVWITDECFKANTGQIDVSGWRCWGGLDLASWIDLNAFVLLFENDGKMAFKCWFWIPEENLVNKKDKNDYRQWVSDGHILTTPGNVIDFRKMADDVVNICQEYKPESVGYDPKFANHGIIQRINEKGIECIEVAQRAMVLSPSVMEIEKLMLEGNLINFGNPVIRWMFGNVEIMRDTNDNMKVDKGRSKNKVDGVSALVNAFCLFTTQRIENKDEEIGISFF